jgi:hypothetical protein
MRALHVVVAAGALVAGAFATACAALLGFEDAVDLHDGGSLFDVTADGLVAPSEASGMVCVPAPPSQFWVGPLILYEARGASLPPRPDCPAPYVFSYDLYADPTGSPAECNCACSAPMNVACSPPVMSLFANSPNCDAGMPCPTPTKAINPTCTPLPVGGGCGGPHFTISAPMPEGGSCAASSGQPSLPPSSWTTEVRLCKFDAGPGGCPEGKVATPVIGLPFEPNYCVTQRTDTQCPPTYPKKRTYYDTYADERACDPCTCGPPVGVTCGGTVTTGDNNCMGGAVYAVPLTTCTNDPKMAAFFSGGADGGSCAPQSHPKGGLTPTTPPTTVCCVQ